VHFESAFANICVLKCGFNYDSSTVRSRDQETISVEKTVFDSQFSRRGPYHTTQVTPGSTRVSQEKGGVSEGKCGQQPSWWFPWKGTSEADLALVSLSDFSRICGV
jgi:hypothetical protein